MDRDVEADDPAVTAPEDLDAVDLQLAQELDGVFGHVVVVERTFRGIGGATVTHLLRRDHLKRRKGGPHRTSPLDRGCAAMQDQQRRAFAMCLVVHVQPVDLCVSGELRHPGSMTATGRRAQRQPGLTEHPDLPAVRCTLMPMSGCRTYPAWT